MHYLPLEKVPDPKALFPILSRRGHCVWLDSSDPRNGKRSRWSIMSAEPERILHSESHHDFIEQLSNEVAIENNMPPEPLPFASGWIGHFDYCHRMPPYPSHEALPIEGWFGYYNKAILWDQKEKKAWLTADDTINKQDLLDWYEEILREQTNSTPPSQSEKQSVHKLTKSLTEEQYKQGVEKAKEWIGRGDIYQVNLSQFMETTTKRNAVDIYLSLRDCNPAPYAAYLDCGAYQILSSSPESFLRLDGQGCMETSPIKGTRPRGKNQSEDKALAEELLTNEKEKAELLMIVDMERNDLGRVCLPGSLRVDQLYQLESFQSVHHLVADIRGQLLPHATLQDILRATFPGGSITGAPKHRAMQIINQLEGKERQSFCGAIGYFNGDGQAQCNIAIRTIRKEGNTLSFGVGAGIVWDSDPAAEYRETWYKAERLLHALGHRSEY